MFKCTLNLSRGRRRAGPTAKRGFLWVGVATSSQKLNSSQKSAVREFTFSLQITLLSSLLTIDSCHFNNLKQVRPFQEPILSTSQPRGWMRFGKLQNLPEHPQPEAGSRDRAALSGMPRPAPSINRWQGPDRDSTARSLHASEKSAHSVTQQTHTARLMRSRQRKTTFSEETKPSTSKAVPKAQFEEILLALAGVAQWIGSWPVNHRVTSLIPSQGTCLGCGPGPQ